MMTCTGTVLTHPLPLPCVPTVYFVIYCGTRGNCAANVWGLCRLRSAAIAQHPRPLQPSTLCRKSRRSRVRGRRRCHDWGPWINTEYTVSAPIANRTISYWRQSLILGNGHHINVDHYIYITDHTGSSTRLRIYRTILSSPVSPWYGQ